jgi:hypothetical protein
VILFATPKAADGAKSSIATTASAALVRRNLWLSECKCIRLGASVEERDLERPLADGVVLAHELVEAAVAEDAVSVPLDVDVVSLGLRPGSYVRLLAQPIDAGERPEVVS